jgi:hypothetical protein
MVKQWKVAYVSGLYLNSKMFNDKQSALKFAKENLFSMTMRLISMDSQGNYSWKLHNVSLGFWLVLIILIYFLYTVMK